MFRASRAAPLHRYTVSCPFMGSVVLVENLLQKKLVHRKVKIPLPKNGCFYNLLCHVPLEDPAAHIQEREGRDAQHCDIDRESVMA